MRIQRVAQLPERPSLDELHIRGGEVAPLELAEDGDRGDAEGDFISACLDLRRILRDVRVNPGESLECPWRHVDTRLHDDARGATRGATGRNGEFHDIGMEFDR